MATKISHNVGNIPQKYYFFYCFPNFSNVNPLLICLTQWFCFEAFGQKSHKDHLRLSYTTKPHKASHRDIESSIMVRDILEKGLD